MRTDIPLRTITIEEIYKDVQKLRGELQTHNHLTFGSQGLTGTVSGILQSPNFVTGSSGSGWQILPDGSVEFNSGYFRGDISGASGTFTGSISIGSGNNIFKADSNGIYLGHATFASAPFRVTMAGALVATSATITGTITISAGSGIANLSDAGALAVLDVVGDAQFSGTLTVGKTEAKCTDANADQTSVNTAAAITGQGSLATQNTVGTSDCDVTIISGGKIITGLLTADNIQTGTLTGRTVRTAISGARAEMSGANNDFIVYNTNGYKAIRLYDDFLEWYDGLVGEDVMTLIGSTTWNEGGMYFSVSRGAGGTQQTLYFEYLSLYPWTTNLTDLATNARRFKNLYLSGNIVVDGTVDGVDIAAHAGNASAHHSSVSNALAITPASVNVGAGNILGSGNLGSSSYEWSTLYFAQGGGVKAGSTVTRRIMQFLSYAGNGKVILGETDWHANIVPYTSGVGYVGTVAAHFYQVTADRIRYDTDSVVFQEHDDIKLLKDIKAIRKEGKDVWDKKSFPKEVVEEGMYDVATMQGFLVGTIKQLIQRVEELEAK